MTELQYLARQDQMDAFRRDFNERWFRDVLPTIRTLSPRERIAQMQRDWMEEVRKLSEEIA